eukprot:SAG11_NODE_352_length_10364_cov_17.751388_2_plen_615_part_00
MASDMPNQTVMVSRLDQLVCFLSLGQLFTSHPLSPSKGGTYTIWGGSDDISQFSFHMAIDRARLVNFQAYLVRYTLISAPDQYKQFIGRTYQGPLKGSWSGNKSFCGFGGDFHVEDLIVAPGMQTMDFNQDGVCTVVHQNSLSTSTLFNDSSGWEPFFPLAPVQRGATEYDADATFFSPTWNTYVVQMKRDAHREKQRYTWGTPRTDSNTPRFDSHQVPPRDGGLDLVESGFEVVRVISGRRSLAKKLSRIYTYAAAAQNSTAVRTMSFESPSRWQQIRQSEWLYSTDGKFKNPSAVYIDRADQWAKPRAGRQSDNHNPDQKQEQSIQTPQPARPTTFVSQPVRPTTPVSSKTDKYRHRKHRHRPTFSRRPLPEILPTIPGSPADSTTSTSNQSFQLENTTLAVPAPAKSPNSPKLPSPSPLPPLWQRNQSSITARQLSPCGHFIRTVREWNGRPIYACASSANNVIMFEPQYRSPDGTCKQACWVIRSLEDFQEHSVLRSNELVSTNGLVSLENARWGDEYIAAAPGTWDGPTHARGEKLRGLCTPTGTGFEHIETASALATQMQRKLLKMHKQSSTMWACKSLLRQVIVGCRERRIISVKLTNYGKFTQTTA